MVNTYDLRSRRVCLYELVLNSSDGIIRPSESLL